MIKKFLKKIERVGFDVAVLCTIALVMFLVPGSFFPIEAKVGLVSIFITKFILVSAAIVHAHITRKLLFSYIDFSKESDLTNNLMIIAWYVIVIFGWTRGG